MKLRMKYLLSFAVCMLTMFVFAYAMADDGVVAPQDFLAQVMDVIQKFGGLSMVLKIAAVITLVISSMKVSFLNELIWSKLGAAQAWVGPILGLIAGVLDLAGAGPLSAARIFAYISAGAGAVILHELLDTVKALPGIGAVWVTIINFVSGLLGGPKPS